MAKHKSYLSEFVVCGVILVIAGMLWASVHKIDEDTEIDGDLAVTGDSSVDGDHDVTGNQTVGGDSTVIGTVTGSTVTDGITSITSGNYTGVGGIAATANIDIGDYELRAQTLEADVATGTSPLTISSTTLVSNLNVDLLDSQTGGYYIDSANFTGTNWTDLTDSGDTTLHDHDGISENTAARHTQGTDTTLGTMTADIDMDNSYQVVNLQAPAASGEAIRQTAVLTEATLEAAVQNYITATLTQEQVEDYAGNLVTDGTGTHTRITIAYQDATGDVDFVVDDMNDDIPEAGDYTNLTATTPITNSPTGTIGITVLKDIVTTSPITGGTDNVLVGVDGDVTIAIPAADTDTDGYLSQTDWDTFNDKQTAGNYITALTGNVTASGPGSVVATIAANAVINTMIAADEVYDSNINWGTGANQVSAVDILIADGGSIITGTEVETALQENRIAIDLNTAKNTNVSTSLSVGTVGVNTVAITSDGGADDVTLPAATVSTAGMLTTAKWAEVVANTAKATNVSTALSAGTVNATTYGITSDGGADDIVLPEADTNNAGLLGADKWDEIVANTTHKTSDGSDHTFIDQSVISGASPTFNQITATGAVYMNDTACGIYENDSTGELEFYDDVNGGYTLSDLAASGAAGDSVSIDGVGVTDPDFVSTGDIDFVDTSNTVTANIIADKVTEAMLKCVNAAVDEYILTKEDTTGDYEWHHPAELITAGTNISWSGTTLNVTGGSGDMSYSDTRFDTISASRNMTSASGDVSYTGTGFTPAGVSCVATIYDSGELASGYIGFTAGVGLYSSIEMLETGVWVNRADRFPGCRTSGGNQQTAVLKSFDANGFTLTWTKQGTPTGGIYLEFFCLR